MVRTFFIACALSLCLSGCADRHVTVFGNGAEEIRISGSTTMELLLHGWANAYIGLHPDVSISVESTTSADGVSSLINGRTDVCAASRPLLPAEAKEMLSRRHSIGIAVRAAKDALSIYVHPSNPIANLTTDQITAILKGDVTNWDQVGGNDEPILVFARERGSGSATFLEEHLLLGDAFSSDAILLESTEAVVQAVTSHPNGIGFGGIAYGSELKHISIDGVAPSPENVQNDTYPISRYLFLFTVDQPQGRFRNFIHFILSKEGQEIAGQNGFVPLYEHE